MAYSYPINQIFYHKQLKGGLNFNTLSISGDTGVNR